jgi:hypothetical protein
MKSNILSIQFNNDDTCTQVNECFLQNCSNFNTNLVLPSSVQIIAGYFMDSCINFNSSITLPTDLQQIYIEFMVDCTAFNQPLVLPYGLLRIGQQFLMRCTSFNQDLTLPNSLDNNIWTQYGIGPDFMRYADGFHSTVNIGTIPASRFYLATGASDKIWAAKTPTAPAYVDGIKIVGTDVANLLIKFPPMNDNTPNNTGYRNLINGNL